MCKIQAKLAQDEEQPKGEQPCATRTEQPRTPNAQIEKPTHTPTCIASSHASHLARSAVGVGNDSTIPAAEGGNDREGQGQAVL